VQEEQGAGGEEITRSASVVQYGEDEEGLVCGVMGKRMGFR